MTELIIAPDGNDHNPGTLDQPVATLAKALELAKNTRDHDTAILFREGNYLLDETALIGKDSEPNPGKTLRIAAYPSESVRLSGGKPLSGWTPVPGQDGIWQAPLPQLPGNKTRVHALYHQTEGLLPRSSSHPTIKEGFETTNERCGRFPTDFCTTYDARTKLHFPEGSLKPWDNLEDIEIYMSPQRPWLVNYLGIASLDFETGIAKLSPQATYEAIGKFVVQNHIDFVTEPGEWAVDSQQRLVFYKPLAGEPGDDILLPWLDELIRVEGINDLTGTDDDPVRGIHIEGLTLSHTDRAVWQPEDIGIQHDWSMWDKQAALIRFRGAEDCSVNGCTLAHGGGDGIRLDLYAQNITISHNHIHHTGGVGVLLAGYGPGYKDVNHHNLVLDNHIHDTGTLYPHSMGVFVSQSGYNRIAHNHIHDLGYMGIVLSGIRRRFWNPEMRPRDIREIIGLIDYDVTAHLEGGEGSWNDYRPYMHCKVNLVEMNEIHDCMRLLNDGNAIYLSATGPDNQIRSNLVYNHPAGGNALMRTDDDQFDSVWEQNIIIGNSGHFCSITHKGGNAFNNNLIINGYLTVYTGVHGPSEDVNSIRNNVFYYEEAMEKLLLRDDSGFGVGKTDHNLFWSTNPDTASALLKDRQATGCDEHSRVADPMLEDLNGLCFTPQPDSPLWAMGFQKIDAEKIGQFNDPALKRLRKTNNVMRGAKPNL